jgi:hypothetical protein
MNLTNFCIICGKEFQSDDSDATLCPEHSGKAQILFKMLDREYNTIRPHSTLDYRPPAPVAIDLKPSQFQKVGLT